MTGQKRFFAALMALLMALALAACNSSDPAPTPPVEEQDDPAAETVTVKLVANFSNGAPDAIELGLYQYLDVEIAAPVTVEALAQELTNWTGLDFFINGATVDADKITVDWSSDATLIAGLDERALKEEFTFYDVVSLNFFMMDSLLTTIEENIALVEVYYTMDGGQPLSTAAIEDMTTQGFSGLPSDVPYMGSAFFVTHSDVVGE